MSKIRLKIELSGAGLVLRRWIFLLICLNPLYLLAQNYPVRHFTIHDGLPSLGVRCVFKDSRGLIWIGTDGGLCTYDGKTIKTLKSSEGMTASRIWSIAEDEQGNLWFGSYGDGIFKYDGVRYRRFTEKDGLADDHVRVICYSEKFQCLIAGSQTGISMIRGDTAVSLGKDLFNQGTGTCFTDIVDAGEFFLITTYSHHSPLRYYPDKNQFVILNDQGKYYPPHSFSGYISSAGDTVLSLINRGIRIYGKNGMVQNDSLGEVYGITEDNLGNLWMAAWSYQNMELDGGIFRYDGITFRNFKKSFGIEEKEIWSVFYDREQDMLWIGTEKEGLFRVSSLSIKNYPPSYFNLDKQKINGLFLDSKNTLWISGNRELIKMGPDGSWSFLDKSPMVDAYRRFWNDSRQKGFPAMGPTMLAAKNLNVRDLSEFLKRTEFNFYRVINDTDHSMIYSSELGLFRFEAQSNQTAYLGHEGALGEIANTGDTLVTGGWGTTLVNPDYLASRLGLDNSTVIDPDGFFRFTGSGDPNDVDRMVKQGHSIWYVSGVTGLWMSSGKRLVHFNDYDSTISDNLKYICFDHHGHVIFGSNTGEICIGTYKEGKLAIDYRINGDQGLQGNTISWLLTDLTNHLWVGTNRGLNCLDLNELYSNGHCAVRFIDEESGYSGESSTQAVIDSAGILWIGAEDQLIELDTKEILSDSVQPGKVILSSFEVNMAPADSLLKPANFIGAPLYPGVLSLNHLQNSLVFQFDHLNYLNPGGDRFRYMLRGYDKTWHEWGTERKAVYTNLPPGSYLFCAESYNLKTLVKAESLNVELKIHHPWWGLWYLQVLMVILFLLLLSIMVVKYVENERRKQQKESEIERKMFHLQYLSLANQFNPHLTFNLFNTVAGFLHSSQIDEALKLTNRYAQLLRRTLFNSRSFKVSFDEELKAVRDLLEVEVIGTEGSFTYDIQTSPDHAEVMLPRSLIFMFVENAIKHGARAQSMNPLVCVRSRTEGSTLIIEIQDNGPGSNSRHEPNSSGTRNGFKIADEIIELYFLHSKSRISYEFLPAADDSPETFTVVTIRVPLVDN